MMRRATILAATLALAITVMAAPATAQITPGPQVPGGLNPPPPPPPPAQKFDEGGISTLQLALIFGGAIAVIGGIAWFIMRDARRAAPVPERGVRTARAGGGSGGATPGSAQARREREQRERARRAKTKAQKQQRKRNRPR